MSEKKSTPATQGTQETPATPATQATQGTQEAPKKGRGRPAGSTNSDTPLKFRKEITTKVLQKMMERLCQGKQFVPTNRSYIEFILENSGGYGSDIFLDESLLSTYIRGLVDGMENSSKIYQKDKNIINAIEEEFALVMNELGNRHHQE